MDPKWKIKVYESPSGEKYVEVFIKSLDEKAQLKVSRTLDLLEAFGLEGASPHVKKLIGTPIQEKVEQARTSPSISFLKRLASALNTSLSVQFK